MDRIENKSCRSLLIVLLIVSRVFLVGGFGGKECNWEELSCSFTTDLCSWTTNAEIIGGTNSDAHGWMIYSTKDGQSQFNHPPNTDNEGSFAYASIPYDASRAFLTSPPTDVSKWDLGQTMSISFDYMTTGSPLLNLYVLLNDAGYKHLWSSVKSSTESTLDDDSESTGNGTSLLRTKSIDMYRWKTEKLTNLCQLNQVSGLLRLSFVAYLTKNDSVSISNFITEKQMKANKADNCTVFLQRPTSDSVTAPENEISATWKFFIIFALFLCFGAVFVSALLIVGKSTKTIYVPPNIERGPETEPDTLKIFKYRKLLETEES